MKKLVYTLVITTVILFGLTFAYLNPHPVEVQYYQGAHWQGPLSMLLFVTWVLGALVGYLLSLLSSLRVRRELHRTRRELRQGRASSNTA